MKENALILFILFDLVDIRKMHDKLTEKIIGCAFQVYNRLGFGFLESVYKKSLLIELAQNGLAASEEVPITVFYENQPVGEFYADILVENLVILELKSIQKLAVPHEVQLVNYLVATKKDVGLLLNFGPSGVEVKRKYRKPKKLPMGL